MTETITATLAILIAASCAGADVGPRLTNAEFFEMLDYSRPELSNVEAAVRSGDMEAAKHEFAAYLRNRKKPVWSFDWRARPKHDSRPAGIDTSEADRILQRDLPSVGVYHKFDGEIDWNLDPINYKEWPFQLNRHPFWVTLGRAYWATGDEKYAREFVYQMTDWVAKNPIPLNASGNSTLTWRTIEQGIRCAYAWPDSFFYFLSSPSFTDDAVVTMVKSFVEHARHLTKWHTGGNWLTMEADGLMHVGVLFPEFKESEQWRKAAADRLYSELDRQVYPDGAQIELTTGYHQVSLNNFVRAWEIAHLNDAPMPADYVAKLEKMYEYNLKVAMPDMRTPSLNDGSHVSVRSSLKEALRFFPNREDFQWVASSGRQGEQPKFTSVALPFAGQLVMRSGWEPDARYLMMDAGPFGYGHQHEDALSVVLFAYGKYQIVDPGNYAYDSSQWRTYVLSARAHNTIMVDGEEQHRRGQPRGLLVVHKPLPNKWASSDAFDYASGSYDYGYGAKNELRVRHTRNVFFAKPDYWIITDFLTPEDDKPHRYESIFHLDADDARIDEATKSVQTLNNKDAGNLSIIPLAGDGLDVRIVKGQEKPNVQGWVPVGSVNEYKTRAIPTPIFDRKASGPASLAYVFYPTPKGVGCPITKVERVAVQAAPGVQAVGLVVRFADGRSDYFVQAEKRAKLRWGAFETDALAAYVRMNGDHVESAMVLDGTEVSRGGKRIPAEALPVQDLSRTSVRHEF